MKLRIVPMAIIMGVVALGVLFFLRGQAIMSLQRELHKLQVQQEELIEENGYLRGLLARKDDLGYLEYLARRELGLIKPGEEKYILIEGEP